MNKLFKSLVLAGAIAGSGAAANAATLVYDFAGSVDLTIPAEYADLYAIWNESPAYATFRGTIILPAFENYLTGTHEIALNTAGLQLSIVSGLLGEIEGTRANVTAPNPAFDPSLPTCTSGRGCDLDGDGVRETPTNNPNMTVGGDFRPDATQWGDSGTLTIVDGKITGFSWEASSADNQILSSYNERLFERGNWPVRIGSIEVELNGATASYGAGDVYFASNNFGNAAVVMTAAVPEPETYAMMGLGLAVVGVMAARRKRAA